MGFKDKLDQICISADRDANRLLKRYTHNLALLMAAVLKTRRWTDLPVKTQRHLEHAAHEATDAAELADSAEFANERLLAPVNGRIVDLKMQRDLRYIQAQIRELFDRGDAPARGFVYVAWSGRPERFMYVGKARQVGRVNLATHGKLANAAAHVTTLSLLFPNQSREETILGLEASVLRLVEFWTDALPELNDHREVVPVGGASMSLQRLGGFLVGVAKKIDRVES